MARRSLGAGEQMQTSVRRRRRLGRREIGILWGEGGGDGEKSHRTVEVGVRGQG